MKERRFRLGDLKNPDSFANLHVVTDYDKKIAKIEERNNKKGKVVNFNSKNDPTYDDEYGYEEYKKEENQKIDDRRSKWYDNLIDTVYKEKEERIQKKNDILNSLSMPASMEPKKTGKGKEALSPEDLKLQSAVYALYDAEIDARKKKYGNKINDERNQRDLADFIANPYATLEVDIKAHKAYLEERLKKPKDKAGAAKLKAELDVTTKDLSTLLTTFSRNIPLKLESLKFTAKEIELGGGNIFNVDQVKKILDERVGPNKKYEIKGLIQRWPGEFIIIKTDKGEIELELRTADTIFAEEKSQREDLFKTVKAGDTITAKFGGIDAKPTVYKIRGIKNGEISYVDSSKKKIVIMSLDQLQDQLVKQSAGFTVTPEIPEPEPEEDELDLEDDLDLDEDLDVPLEDEEALEAKKLAEKQKNINAVIEEILAHNKKSSETKAEFKTKKELILAEIAESDQRLSELTTIREELLTKELAIKEEAKPEEEKTGEVAGEERKNESLDGEEGGQTIELVGNLKAERATLKAKIEADEKDLKKTRLWEGKKRKALESSLLESKKQLYAMEKQERQNINLDAEKKPFMYFAARKILNRDIVKVLADKDLQILDLRDLANATTQSDFELNLRGGIIKTGENEGFFEFNTLGFVKIVKNLKELQQPGNKIDFFSENAVYKVVGPDGTIIADDLKGRMEANKIYYGETEKYQKALEEEFANLTNK